MKSISEIIKGLFNISSDDEPNVFEWNFDNSPPLRQNLRLVFQDHKSTPVKVECIDKKILFVPYDVICRIHPISKHLIKKESYMIKSLEEDGIVLRKLYESNFVDGEYQLLFNQLPE